MVCINCGNRNEVTDSKLPNRPDIIGNKDEFIRDYYALTMAKMTMKYTASTTTIKKFLDSWGIEPKLMRIAKEKEKKRKGVAVMPALQPCKSNGLPDFPEFSNEWPETVMIHWLDCYMALATNTTQETANDN